MEKINLNTEFISAKTASELSHKAIMQNVDKSVTELVPIINKAIERACLAAQCHIEIDLTKYNHFMVIVDKLSKDLKELGYKTKLVDDDCRGYYLYISWA